MSLRSSWTFDEAPRPRLTPDEITARAEEYLQTGSVECYGDLGFRELQEFWSEAARLKRMRGLGAWRRP